MARLLIVDDSEDQRELYSLILEAEGWDIAEAADGAAGLRAVAMQRPDVVLLDMMMPDVDGLQFLQRLPIECPAPLPAVIAVSGFPAYREEALRRGAYAFLGKPIGIDVLLEVARAASAARPLPAEIGPHNRLDVSTARARGEELRAEIIAELPPPALAVMRARLRALVTWLQRYYGFGSTAIQLLRGSELNVEATFGGPPPWAEGYHYPRQVSWCSDVIDAGSAVLLSDAAHHALPYFARHPSREAGLRFYAGVPLKTRSGVVIGTLCICDAQPHILHAEDIRLLHALALPVACAFEDIADGDEVGDFGVDANALFGAGRLPLFMEVAVQRAGRSGGAVGLAMVRLDDDEDLGAAARAAYAGGSDPGLVAVRGDSGDEVVLVQIGREGDARRNLTAAVHACRHAVVVRSIGSAWCHLAAGTQGLGAESAADLSARLLALAAASHDRHGGHEPAPEQPHDSAV